MSRPRETGGKVKAVVTAQSHLRRWLFCWLIVSLVLFAACSGEREAVDLSGRTMGTSWHVTYVPAAQQKSIADMQQGIEGILEEVNGSMSTYLSDSEISSFNLAAVGQWFPLSSGFVEVLQAAMVIGDVSGGAYDVTVGPVVNLWGFGPDSGGNTIPDKNVLMRLLQQLGQNKLRLDEKNQRVLKSDELSLDFSSIAKGYGVDRVAQWLVSHGVVDFLVEVGGEMRLHGLNPRGEPWRIAIEQPDGTIGSVAMAISLTNSGLATSGDYRNYFEVDGRRYSHTIDPRTGYPIEHDLVSVTVVHPSAMLADGWATAFMVMGAEDAMKVALQQGLAVYFIRRGQGNYISSYSPLFERYLETSQ